MEINMAKTGTGPHVHPSANEPALDVAQAIVCKFRGYHAYTSDNGRDYDDGEHLYMYCENCNSRYRMYAGKLWHDTGSNEVRWPESWRE